MFAEPFRRMDLHVHVVASGELRSSGDSTGGGAGSSSAAAAPSLQAEQLFLQAKKFVDVLRERSSFGLGSSLRPAIILGSSVVGGAAGWTSGGDFDEKGLSKAESVGGGVMSGTPQSGKKKGKKEPFPEPLADYNVSTTNIQARGGSNLSARFALRKAGFSESMDVRRMLPCHMRVTAGTVEQLEGEARVRLRGDQTTNTDAGVCGVCSTNGPRAGGPARPPGAQTSTEAADGAKNAMKTMCRCPLCFSGFHLVCLAESFRGVGTDHNRDIFPPSQAVSPCCQRLISWGQVVRSVLVERSASDDEEDVDEEPPIRSGGLLSEEEEDFLPPSPNPILFSQEPRSSRAAGRSPQQATPARGRGSTSNAWRGGRSPPLLEEGASSSQGSSGKRGSAARQRGFAGMSQVGYLSEKRRRIQEGSQEEEGVAISRQSSPGGLVPQPGLIGGLEAIREETSQSSQRSRG